MQVIKQKALFLDRDGVINTEMGRYVFSREEFHFEPGIFELCRAAVQAGYKLIVITNQGGIQKGIYTVQDTDALHAWMASVFLTEGCALTDIYFSHCHKEFSKNILSKPSSLMIEKACARHNIDPAQSWMIGDQPRDLMCGATAGCRTIGIGTHTRDEKADAWFENTASVDLHLFR